MKVRKKTQGKAAILAFALAPLAGCASVQTVQVIKPGETVGIHFTCRFPDGYIAVTSEKAVAEDETQPKSRVFIKRAAEDLLEVKAGGDPEYPSKQVTTFEEDVMQGIAVKLPGLRSGEDLRMELESAGSVNGQLKLSRIRHASKKKRVLIEDYRKHTGKEPEAGQTIFMEGELPGVVKEVKEGEALIAFSAPEGTVVQTPIGPGRLRDAGSRYDIVIDAKPGGLMRMGPWAGRIKSADDREMELDFSKLYGGENLSCLVKAETVKEETEKTPPEPAPADSAAAAGQAEDDKGASTSPEEKNVDVPSPEEIERKVAVLNRAISEGMKKGERSISIDADLLFAQAERGDLVTLRYAAREPGGAQLAVPTDMAAPNTPQELIAGNQEVFPGLGEAVIGMAAGDRKKITLPPDKAFGPRSPANNAYLPLESTVPKKINMAADEYVKRFGGFPSVGKEVPLIPNLTTKVSEVGEKGVTLKVSAKDGAGYDEPYGKVTVAVSRDNITLKLAPKLGAEFMAGDRRGLITASDGINFTVDFNHPLAGKTIEVDMEVLSVKKSSTLSSKPVTWLENHDAGVAEAGKEGKPAVMVLYADWCGFCKRLFSESIPDPRVAGLGDSFVWVKVNSDKEKQYGNLYGQNGFPMIVLLNPDGSVAEKIEGYRDGAALSRILKGFLNGKKG